MAEATDPTVSVVIVNWNTANLLSDCLGSIESRLTLPFEILVVDNASEDGSAEMVRERFPAVRLLAQTENLGYPRGNNVAAAEARGVYLLLLNPDTVVREGAVESLIEFLGSHPRAGAAGPPLYHEDGSPQRSVQVLPSLGSELLHQTMLHRVLPSRVRRTANRRDTRRVEVLTGAALCIRRSCWDEVGPLDENIFMFYEDTDWCHRALEAGYEIWYVEGPGVEHVKAAASARHARTRTLLASQRSMLYYFDKHHGEGAHAALRGIGALGAVMRSLRAAVLWVVGLNRGDQEARLRAYGRILGWSLRGGNLE